MFRVIGALTGANRYQGNEISNDERTKMILQQAHDFEIALQAMDFVLDDHAEKGHELLNESEKISNGDKTIYFLARGVIEFLEATLGFEAPAIKKASDTLSKAEQLSWNSRQRLQKQNLKTSTLYPPGTEYAVTYTESCLLHGLLMLFSESVVESAKALFKLRKAYQMLQEILNEIKQAESKKKSTIYLDTLNESTASFISTDITFTSVDIPYKLTPQEQNDKDLLDFANKVYQMRKNRLCGAHIGNTPAFHRLRTELGSEVLKDLSDSECVDATYLSDSVDESQATVDEFIHSGVNLCFGILQVVLSLIPPAIGAVLSIVGFHGSREEGLRMVWKSTKNRNIHGGIGLLSLLFYYDGPFQFSDVDFDIPIAEDPLMKIKTGELDNPTLLNPGKVLLNALLQARALFPNSALWLLQESRMLSSQGELETAVNLMDSINVHKIEMVQVKALMVFDRAITLVHLHRFERAAEDLLSLIEINEWSHAFYTYFAGCCYLESYRMCQMGLLDCDRIEFYRMRAIELIFSAPNLIGKKKFMSKNLPLDRFMLRKVEQFKNFQSQFQLNDPLDAIGVSPVHELSYFYNGYNRMTKENLELSYKLLNEYHNPLIDARNLDQEMIKSFLTALTLRRLGKVQEGCELLDEYIIPQICNIQSTGKVKYIKKIEDPWLYPASLYERALFTWKLENITDLKQTKEWLMRAQNYMDDYELSTRIGMKIKAAIDRLDGYL